MPFMPFMPFMPKIASMLPSVTGDFLLIIAASKTSFREHFKALLLSL
jgi:hypothetical protein